jgi:hypothetical protein
MSSRKNTRNNRSTHKLFFQTITSDMLNELMNRVSDGVLRNDIQNVIGTSFFVIITLSDMYQQEKNKLSLYITFYKKLDGQKNMKKLGYISFHMFPNDNKIPGEIGILHIRNISDGQRPLLVRKNNQTNKITLSISNNGGSGLLPVMKECGNKAISVLNQYVNPDEQLEPLSLVNHRTTLGNVWNPYVDIIEKAFDEQPSTRKLQSR